MIGVQKDWNWLKINSGVQNEELIQNKYWCTKGGTDKK